MKEQTVLQLTEEARTRMIGDIATALNAHNVPADAKAAGLTLIGWLARRMPYDTSPPDDGTRRRR